MVFFFLCLWYNMSTWARNIQWDESAIQSLTGANETTSAPTAAPTTMPATTVAPTTTAAPTLPPMTTSSPRRHNPGFGSGSGGVVFPLPVAPSLLMDGDISALNPITDAPTTMAPTLPPFPMMSMATEPAVDKKRQMITYGVGAIIVVGILAYAYKKGVFKKVFK